MSLVRGVLARPIDDRPADVARQHCLEYATSAVAAVMAHDLARHLAASEGSSLGGRSTGELQVKTLMRLLLVIASVVPALVFAGPAAAEEGGKKVTAELCKHPTGAAFRNRGQCVSSAPTGVLIQPGPQPSWFLEVDQGQPYDCNPPTPGAQCWGILTGSGLAPFSVVHVVGNGRGFNGTHATVRMDGTVGVNLAIPCNVNRVQAQGTAADGTLTSPTQPVDAPGGCPTGA
jgi:hypothetical protein